jgi:hypothetical protein
VLATAEEDVIIAEEDPHAEIIYENRVKHVMVPTPKFEKLAVVLVNLSPFLHTVEME